MLTNEVFLVEAKTNNTRIIIHTMFFEYFLVNSYTIYLIYNFSIQILLFKYIYTIYKIVKFKRQSLTNYSNLLNITMLYEVERN